MAVRKEKTKIPGTCRLHSLTIWVNERELRKEDSAQRERLLNGRKSLKGATAAART